MTSKVLRYALRYAELGYPVLPLKPRGKTPLTPHGLHDATTNPETIRNWWGRWPNANTGLRTGAESGFFVLDIDGAEGEFSLEALETKSGKLPDTRQSRTGGGGRHFLFKYPSHPVKNFNDGRLGKGLDVRGDGGYIVVPPSIHSSGKLYEWVGEQPSPIADAPEWLLEKLARDKAAKAPDTNVQRPPARIQEGGRHQALLSYAGKLRHAGADESEILAALQVFNETRCDPPKAPSELEMIARYVATRNAPGIATESAWPALRRLPARIPVHSCPLEALPSTIADWASDLAERCSVPVDLPVAAIIVTLSAAIGRRIRVQPKRRDTAYIVVPNLWGVMIAAPGSKKSPVINDAKKFLQHIDRRWRLEYEQARQHYEKELTALKRAKGKQAAAEEAERENPIEPRRRHALVNDATAEALHEVLAANPAGVLVLRDELPGWLGGLEKQGREGDRGFWLETWSGDGAYNSVRIARGATDADALCVSLFGGVQPGPWMEYAAKAPADGMLQRFQILVCPDPLPKVQLVDRAPNQAAEDRVEAVFERLIGMPVEPPRLLSFSNGGQDLHDAWLKRLEDRIAQGSDPPEFTNHLAKYRSLMPSLACIFELVENADAQSIDLDAARRAAAFCEYLESHATRSYQACADSVYQAASTLAKKLEAGTLGSGSRFSLREAYRSGWTGLKTAADARAVCEVLTDHGWIRPLAVQSSSGRPSESFEVNPEVYG